MIDYIQIIKQIYAAEISVRISWTWDAGFHWFLLDGKKMSRLSHDLRFLEIQQEGQDKAIDPKGLFFPDKDWIDYGVKDTFQGMILDLSNSIAKHFPKSPFTEWYKDNVINSTED
jgi:hypothetical protein